MGRKTDDDQIRVQAPIESRRRGASRFSNYPKKTALWRPSARSISVHRDTKGNCRGTHEQRCESSQSSNAFTDHFASEHSRADRVLGVSTETRRPKED